MLSTTTSSRPRHTIRDILLQVGIYSLLPVGLFAADPSHSITLQVSQETAPPSGFAQFKITLTSPHLVSSGTIAMNFDPAVFGDIANVMVFGATGDAIGYANVKGQHLDVHFSSPSAAIGQLPNLPVLVVSIPVLAGVKPGTTTSVSLDASASPWTDSQGNPYTVQTNPANFTVGGSLSVASVIPGGGLLPAGTILQVSGTGFTATTAVSVGGVNISSMVVISPERINLTLGAPTELTGKHFGLTNIDGSRIDFYSALPSAPSNSQDPLPGLYAILPLNTIAAVTFGDDLLMQPLITEGFALLNQNLIPTVVEFEAVDLLGGKVTLQETITIPPSTLYFLNSTRLIHPAGSFANTLWITASAPIRMLNYRRNDRQGRPGTPEVHSFTFPATTPPPPIQLPVSPMFVSLSGQIGTSPATARVDVSGNTAFTVAISSSSPWLSVTPMSGTAPSTLTFIANQSSLGPGTYTGTVTITPVLPAALGGFRVQATTVGVSLTVSAGPLISASETALTFVIPAVGGPSTGPHTVNVASNGTPAPFTVNVTPFGGGNWLSVTPLSGATPAALVASVNGAGLPLGTYSAQITIHGPVNLVAIPVTLLVLGVLPPPPPPKVLRVSPTSLSFFLQSGTGAPMSPQLIDNLSWVEGVLITGVKAESSGNWLTAAFDNPAGVSVNATAANLPAGTYQGTVTITSAANGSVQVPVTLTVWSNPPAGTHLIVKPAAVSVTAQAGQKGQPQTFTVDSDGGPILFSLRLINDVPGVQMVQAAFRAPDGQFQTPATVTVAADATFVAPGVYHSTLIFNWTNGSVSVPLTFSVTASPDSPPILAAIASAASETSGAIAPGEIISLFGSGIGPAPTGFTLDAAGKVATNLSGTRVLINGVAAPLIYASVGQINAIVPYEVGVSGTASIQVISNGIPSAAWGVPLAESAPSIFTIDGTGLGQGAVLNQDNSVNGASNPAARGTVISIFATGEGLTSPPGVTGSVTGSDTKAPILRVTVEIGGVAAMVQYSGSAPFEVAGLLQVNALVPPEVHPGSNVPVLLTIGAAQSQDRVTIAVR